MNLQDLEFSYPETLIATERSKCERIMFVDSNGPRELLSIRELFGLLSPGDLLVTNNTKVLKRRLRTNSGLEILFLSSAPGARRWEVLCPSSRWKTGTTEFLPGGVRLELAHRGKPQTVEADRPLGEDYFDSYGELPLPPYIQKARQQRENRSEDAHDYQSVWASEPGSLAAPTASLHFSASDIASLACRGVHHAALTLHVGLGTFLPISVSHLDEHVMHAESVRIPAETWEKVIETRSRGARIWALGTTVTRALESAAGGLIEADGQGGFSGTTQLFIKPPYNFKVVGGLLTNFHQPGSTLLALVAAFAGLENVQQCYKWAIERKFRLFSYGDLTAWIK